MNTGFGGSNNMFISTLAVVAVILGGAGVYFGLSARNLQTQLVSRTGQLEQRMDTIAQDSERIGGQVRSLEIQTQRALTVVVGQVDALQARLVKPTNVAPDKAGGGTKTEPTGPGGVHVIKSGDTMGSVAKKYGISLEALLKANPTVDSRRLKIGQKVKIPGAAPAAPAAAPAA